MIERAFQMPVVRALALALSMFGLSAAPRAETLASPWVEGYNNKVRLIAGGVPGAGLASAPGLWPWAGVEITMPSGWKTYWRNPGEAGGVPPEFDWTGSENLRVSEVLYPPPHRFSDKSGQTIGYKEHVIFPVFILATENAKSFKLKLKVTFGACKELCVPAEAQLELLVPNAIGASPELKEVRSKVPVRLYSLDSKSFEAKSTEAQFLPWLNASRIDDASGKPKLVLEVNDPGVTGGDAFLYSPDNLYLPLPKKISEADGKAVYEADLSDSFNDLKGKSIGVVLTGAKGQSETMIQIPK